MPWLQLCIDASAENANAVEEALLAAGAISVTLKDNANQAILEPALGEMPLWSETRVTGLFAADINTETTTQVANKVFGGDLPPCHWEALEDKDWQREWMKNYQPIKCGENFWVCPSWQAPPDPKAVNLLLDPGLAFGTGTHPTTFLCLQWLAEQDLHGKTAIDYGCGSGILGIATLLLGAKQVMGVDIDPQALLATRENATRNHLSPDIFPVYLPQKCPSTCADVVIANILAGPLTDLSTLLTSCVSPGGRLCLSGILATQAEEVMQVYGNQFVFDPVVELTEWVRLTAIKKL